MIKVPTQLKMGPNLVTTAKKPVTTNKNNVKQTCLHQIGLITVQSFLLCFLIN